MYKHTGKRLTRNELRKETERLKLFCDSLMDFAGEQVAIQSRLNAVKLPKPRGKQSPAHDAYRDSQEFADYWAALFKVQKTLRHLPSDLAGAMLAIERVDYLTAPRAA